jgi:hypothetical protein
MTPKQKRIVFVLAGANVVILLALALLATRQLGAGDAPRSNPHTVTAEQQACQWEATRLLAGAGLAGTAMLASDGSLSFEITYALPPGANPEDAAQTVWTALDVALAVQDQETECATFDQVNIIILVRGSQGDTRIEASVSAADLAAFGRGELDEDEFVDRVTYSATSEPIATP